MTAALIGLTASAADEPGAWYSPGEAGEATVGRRYRDREISIYKARRSPSSPATLVAALATGELGQVVSIGAGLVNIRLAAATVNGRVLALEFDAGRFAALKDAAQRGGVQNLAGELVGTDLPALPTEPVDLVLIMDSYTSLTEPHALLGALAQQLTPGGQIALVEYRGEDPSIMVPASRKLAQRDAERELGEFGFKLLANDDRLPLRHVMIFGRR